MGNDTIKIRKMKHEDISGVFQLENLWKEEEISYIFEPFTEEYFVQSMTKFNDYHLVAVDNNQVVGYINGFIDNNGDKRVFNKNEEFLMIENLYVREEYRNKKIGGLLIEQIMSNARKNGITRFAVSTDTKDMKSILRFYENHGFKPFHVNLFKMDQ